MNSRDVIKRLRNDVGVIDVPSIPQAVRQAVREQREKYIAYYGQAPEMKKSTRDMVVKGIFAAMVTAMVVSVPIIVVMTNRSPISDLPDTSVLPNSSGTVSAAESQIVTSTEDPKTTLERIKLQQVYGEVALSGKSEEELETLLVTYSTKDSVYEDDRYIYNFDAQGRLVEMRSLLTEFDKNFSVTEKAVLDEVKTLLDEYYSEWNEDSCSISIDNDVDGYPAWTVTITRDNKLVNETITMLFFSTGRLYWMRVDGISNNVGAISKAEAVHIALREIRSGRYNILRFDDKEVDITISSKEIDNKQHYEVCIEKIPYEIINGRRYTAGYVFLVDSSTGECSLVAHEP